MSHNEGKVYKDERIKCAWGRPAGMKLCGTEFTWTSRDQGYYAERGFSRPKYCRPHREERRRQQESPFGEALRQVRSSEAKARNHESDRDQFGAPQG